MSKKLLFKLFGKKANKSIISEDIFQRISENAGDVFWILNIQNELFSYVSPGIERLTGYNSTEILQKPLSEVLTEDSYNLIVSKIPDRIKSLSNGDESSRIRIHEVDQIAKDGRIIHTEVVTTLLQDSRGNMNEVVGVSRDISRRKLAEEALQETQERFRLAFITNPDSININQISDGKYIEINEGFTKITGYTAEEIIGKTSIEANIWYDPADRTRMIEELMATGRVENLEAKFRTKNGEVLTGLMSCAIIKLKGVPHILSITRDIEKIKRFEAELILAKEKAQENDRLKTVFLQNMSHEIRTPMNAIMGFSELLAEGDIDEEKILSYTSIIKQRSGDLLEIINEILDLSKIESGLAPLHKEICNLDELCKDVYEFFLKHRERANKTHISLTYKYTPGIKSTNILTDRVKLKQIFINLLSNAFKFTNEGKIEFGYKMNANNRLIFFVTDSGIGIPKEKHNYIFQRFTQIDDGNSRQQSGTGLGLAIVKGLLELMDGSIWLESAPRAGTTFYFSIPYDELTAETNSSPVELKIPDNFSWENAHFLVVEDDTFNSEYLKDLLTPKGAKLHYARTVKEAISIAASIEQLDLVLLDVRLPESSGYNAIARLRELKPKIRILAQTAYATSEEQLKAIEKGCDDFISKPISKQLLFIKIDKLLKQADRK
jgi:PAS domain S-box-containing protein